MKEFSAVINDTFCKGCSICVALCPKKRLQLSDEPAASGYLSAYLNSEHYRIPPCNNACPTGEKIQSYIDLINQSTSKASLRQAWGPSFQSKLLAFYQAGHKFTAEEVRERIGAAQSRRCGQMGCKFGERFIQRDQGLGGQATHGRCQGLRTVGIAKDAGHSSSNFDDQERGAE